NLGPVASVFGEVLARFALASICRPNFFSTSQTMRAARPTAIKKSVALRSNGSAVPVMRRPRQAAGTNIRRSSDRIVGLIGCDLESAAEYRGSTPPKRGITCAFSALRPEVIAIIFRFSSVSPGRGRHWRQSGVLQMSQRHLEDRRRAIVDQDRII